MKKLLSKKNLLIILLLGFLILLVCGWSYSRAELSAFKKQILKFDLKEQKYIQTIEDNGTQRVEQEQIILSQKDAIANNLLEIKKLKKINSQVVINTITKIDSVFVPFVVDSINNGDTLREDNYIIVPQVYSITDKWYSLDGKIQRYGIMLDSLSFHNELQLTIGQKSNGFLKKTTPVVIVEYSNPYVRTTGMQNIVIKNELKWYDKKGFWLGVGFVGGIGTSIMLKD